MDFSELNLLVIGMIINRIEELDILEQMFSGDELDFNMKDEVNDIKSILDEMVMI